MQKAVIVNGTMELLGAVQPILTAGRYDVVFVDTNAHAYSSIKTERPALVVLCLDMHDRAGFQLLSMLKLDEDTRRIPLLTCLNHYELPDARRADPWDDDALDAIPAASLN
jgi:DNA-binding response OmpR family regulator